MLVAESDNSDGMDVDFEEPSPDTSKKSNVIDKKELVTSSSTSPDDDASSVIYIGHVRHNLYKLIYYCLLS